MKHAMHARHPEDLETLNGSLDSDYGMLNTLSACVWRCHLAVQTSGLPGVGPRKATQILVRT